MSGKKVPNRVCIEVNEVDQALAGSSRIIPSSKASDPNGDVVGNYIILQDGTALDLSAHIAEQVAKQLATFRANDKSASNGSQQGAGIPIDDENSEELNSEEESEDVLEAVFGTSVNNQEQSLAGIGDNDIDLEELSAIQPSLPISDAPLVIDQNNSNNNDVDPDLPILEQSSQNFFPSQRVVDWVRKAMNLKLTDEQIKARLETPFIRDPALDDIFSPIKVIKIMRDPMMSKAAADEDGKDFHRSLCERRLYKGQSLFGKSLAPIMKALTKLESVTGSNEARNLIGEGLIGMSQGWHEITYARRELYRKFVRRDVQPNLYENVPSHSQMFGGESIEGQVTKALAASKEKAQFIIQPQFKSFSHTSKFSSNTKFFRGKGYISRGGSTSNRGHVKKAHRGKAKGRGKGKSASHSPSSK